ncbi:SDR family NAD(P)-dependent oxidoreductase [Caldisericum exile]|uniref:Oxidoreductase n=1 Tax=Caldisericum exile (strain DSM 21853 / NBRC 104410 / AZM16c01) TaxID=511051 RepID=A0A7U6JFH1_CALEA|nr:SDR family NAD(P)-dependent oxidoreductase [Caldisericum exile]BAL81498.1 oxidoreductase [Caldisericum exile AZM16c01]
MLLKDKVIAITGGGTGIGKACALSYAKEGAKVIVIDLNFDFAKNVSDEIEKSGEISLPIKADVTNREEIKKAIDVIYDKFGRIDVWHNNAGVSTMNKFLDLTDKDWDFNMSVNAKGVFIASQEVLRRMINQEIVNEVRGKIINTASMAGKRGNAPFLAHYVASKFAVVGLTQALAGEFAPYKILVNAICPGYVKTSMQEREVSWEAKLRGVSEDVVRELYIKDTPLGRLETPEDVANVAIFLASDLSNFITGEAINVNGGAFMD